MNRLRLLGSISAFLTLVALSACDTVRFGDRRRGDSTEEPVPAAATRGTPRDAAWTAFGTSVGGRPLRIRALGDGPRRALWVGGIHGDEPEGAVATVELEAALLATPGLAAAVTLTIVEDVNPDGRATKQRRNVNGVDLNRNYPSRNYRPGGDRGDAPLSEPEAKALHDLILELRPDVVLVAHSWGRKPTGPKAFINFDGPAAELARTFSALSGYPVVPSTDIHGTPGSLGSFVGIDLGIPILTIEYERGSDPGACWRETREAILAVIAGRVLDA